MRRPFLISRSSTAEAMALTLCLLTVLSCPILAHAGKKPNGGGGGGNNGGGGSQLPSVQYDFQWIGTLGGDFSRANDLNSAGDVVGRSRVSGITIREGLPDTIDEERGFLSIVVDGQRVVIDLYETLSAEDQDVWIRIDECAAINDQGTIVGSGLRWLDAEKTAYEQVQFVFVPGEVDESGNATAPQIYEFPPVADNIRVNDINNNHDITGEFITTSGENHAFLGHLDITSGEVDSFLDLGVLTAGEDFSRGIGLNNFADVVGLSGLNGSHFEAIWYDPSVNQMIGLGGLKRDSTTNPFSINDLVEIVGRSYANRFDQHAFRWRNGVMTDLGTLGGNYSSAMSINNFGEIVGHATDGDGISHAFLYGDEFGMVKLTDLVADPVDATTLESLQPQFIIKNNDSGVVIGHVFNNDGVLQAYILIPRVE